MINYHDAVINRRLQMNDYDINISVLRSFRFGDEKLIVNVKGLYRERQLPQTFFPGEHITGEQKTCRIHFYFLEHGHIM
jgi:hypothetical protein